MSEEKQKKKKSALYSIVRVLGCFLTHTFYPVKYHDLEQLRTMKAPYVLIANHQSWIDPVIAAVAVKDEEVTFLGKKELAKNALIQKFLTGLHMITVDRHKMDMAAMRACIRTVQQGDILGIFPEGTRYHNGVMEEIEDGTALMTMRTGVPLVPVYIAGKPRIFRRTHVYFGEPITYDDLKAQGVNKVTCDLLDDRIRETYRGYQEKNPFIA